MNRPLVSVIVTTYNRENYLRECLVNILAQTYINFEVIIIDNFSNYDILSSLKDFNDNRIKLIQNQNNGKYVINRNIGIKSSRGDFIAFCDDDDLWHPNNLQIKIDHFIKDSSIGMITSKEEIINEIGEKTGKTTHIWVKKTHFVTFKNLFFKNVGSPSAAVIRKSCFNTVGYFDEHDDKKNIEDIDYWLRLSLKFKILYLNEILGSFRIHNKNESRINDNQLLNSYFLRKSFLEKKNIKILPFYNDAKIHIKKLKIKIAVFYFRQKRLIDSLEWLGKLFKD